MPGGQRSTPITDLLYRLEVDPALVERFVDEPQAVAREFGLPADAIAALEKDNIDLTRLQELVDEEHPDRVHLIPRGWVR